MAKCTGCGSDLPVGARFCPLCGRTTIAPAASSSTMPPISSASPAFSATTTGDDGSSAGKKRIAIAAGIGLVLILIGGLTLKAAGVLSARAPSVKPYGVLSQPPVATTPAPLLSAPAPQLPAAPVLQAPQPRAPDNSMPADVIAYLRWLKKFEAYRRDLEFKGMAELTVFTQKATTGAIESFMQSDPTGEPAPIKPEDNPVVGISNVIQDWNKASLQFNQVAPPDPCATLATNYGQALTAGVQQMSQIHSMLTGALASIQGANGQATPMSKDALSNLYREKGSRQGSVNVDASYASANAALDALRGQYTNIPSDIDKPQFDIKAADGGGLKLPFMGGM